MQFLDLNLAQDPRAAGEIRRYHTWPVNRDQSVGEHTWQVLRILLTVWPTAPRNVIVYGLMHDAGEMGGDIQYPFKVLFPELRVGADKAENYVRAEQRKEFGAPPDNHPLSVFERLVFKTCDCLEMWEYGVRETNMGNRYAQIIIERMRESVGNLVASIEGLGDVQQYQQNIEVVASMRKYMSNRLMKEEL